MAGISAPGRGTPLAGTAGLVTASPAMDDLSAGTGVSFRAPTMPSFVGNVLMQLEPIKTKGPFVSPTSGDRKLRAGGAASRASAPRTPPSTGRPRSRRVGRGSSNSACPRRWPRA